MLDALAGADALNETACVWMLRDPGLALAVLRTSARPDQDPGRYRFAECCDQLSLATIKGLASEAALRQLAYPETALMQQEWLRALALGHLCRALAEHAGHDNPDEAWLAGLFCDLPGIQPAMAELPARGFLADVPRFLREPPERLREATLLPRLAAVAWHLRQRRVLEPGDTLCLPTIPDDESLRVMLQEMDKSVEAYSGVAHTQKDLSDALTRFMRTELAGANLQSRTNDGVLAAARLLEEQEGLHDPVYLRLDKRTSMLESQDLGSLRAPPISIRVEGSNTAAVRALSTRMPVVVYRDPHTDAALLDLQLARQADADGIAAIPVGTGDARGVLLICGDRQALAEIAEHPERYRRLGELAGRPGARETTLDDGEAYLNGRVRRAAHEINNPLGIIKNYLAILKAKLGGDAPIADELRIIHEELDRIVRIVRSLAHDDASLAELAEDTDIGVLAEDLLKVTSPSWQPRGIRISNHLHPGLPRLKCDRDKIKQILLNLLLNALDATPDGGEIRLEMAQITNHRRERFIELEISDSGSGIAPELEQQLFDPVATEKGDGHAGLGLAIVKTLTENLGGSIAYKSSSSGTTFQLLFPLG